MVISALGSVKRREKLWYKDETIPFNEIGSQIQNEFHLESLESKEASEEVLCDIRNSLHHMFEVGFLLDKKYLKVDDVIKFTKYYQTISMMPSMNIYILF